LPINFPGVARDADGNQANNKRIAAQPSRQQQ